MRLDYNSEIEQVIRSGFVSILANEIDETVLNGSGSSSKPIGIFNTSRIESVASYTNGLDFTFDYFIDIKKTIINRQY